MNISGRLYGCTKSEQRCLMDGNFCLCKSALKSLKTSLYKILLLRTSLALKQVT